MLQMRRARRSRTRLIGVLVLIIGTLLTTGVGTGWWWTNLHARHTAHSLADQATTRWGLGPGPAPTASGATVVPRPAGINGRVIAVVRAPRLGKSWREPVQRGTGEQVLREGMGLYAGSPMPGAVGNVALAGHRTTWGAPLKHLDRMRPGDVITIWTATGQFDYRVVSQGVTRPTDISVIAPAAAHGTAMLTMTTCNPEFSARQRLYIHAVLVRKSTYS